MRFQSLLLLLTPLIATADPLDETKLRYATGISAALSNAESLELYDLLENLPERQLITPDRAVDLTCIRVIETFCSVGLDGFPRFGDRVKVRRVGSLVDGLAGKIGAPKYEKLAQQVFEALPSVQSARFPRYVIEQSRTKVTKSFVTRDRKFALVCERKHRDEDVPNYECQIMLALQ